jgi:hypothetical protein
MQALRAQAALFYIFVNGLVAFIAFYVVWRIPAGQALLAGQGEERLFYAILIAGFGSMALMRTAVLRTKVGDQEVGIGPSVFVDTLLRVADRGVDRNRANERAASVPQLMTGIPLEFAATTLPLFCLDLLQNLEVKERQDIENRITLLGKKEIPSNMKAIVAGLYLQAVIGTDVLQSTITALQAEIDLAKKQAQTKPPRADLRAELEASGQLPGAQDQLQPATRPAQQIEKPPPPASDPARSDAQPRGPVKEVVVTASPVGDGNGAKSTGGAKPP